jgi:hypothetical protein
MLSSNSFFRGTADEETVAGVAEGEGAEDGKSEGTDEGIIFEGEDSAGTSGKSASTDDGIEGIAHALVTEAEHKAADLPSSNNTHDYEQNNAKQRRQPSYPGVRLCVSDHRMRRQPVASTW